MPDTSPDKTYDPNNIFAKILAGEIPCHKVYEDAKSFAFMDIMPRTEGHTLVIPKAPARNVLDAGDADLAAVIATVKRVANAAIEALGADGITLMQFNEPASGQEVYHLHFHVMPRWDGERLKPPASEMADNDKLAAVAAKLRAALEG